MAGGVVGLSFLTPYAALFVLAAALPLAALVLAERRARTVRRLLQVGGPGRRALVPVAIALVLLPALVAVAAAQPVVVREQRVAERSDVQAFVVLDTSLSMQAAAGPRQPDRLQRAKRLAIRLQHALPDIPMGIASMTDRSLPNLMPTVDRTLFERTVMQSVGIDRPPPSQPYKGRATTFDAIAPLAAANFYASDVKRRLLVVFTDGEAAKISRVLRLTLQRKVTPVFVHVWQPGERIFLPHGRVDRRYVSDPTSTAALADLASLAGGRSVDEHDFGAVARTLRDAAGRAEDHTVVSAYARVPLAPWFVLAAVLPLGFLLWRRNA